MSGLLLTLEDLQALTGAERPSAVIAWLSKHRWIYETDRNGRPKVSRAYFDARMSGLPLPGARVGPRTEFLFS